MNLTANQPQLHKRKRTRKILWFNPPYSQYIENKVGRTFRSLIDKHFKKGTLLGKLFNHNTLKISYSCCPNVKKKVSAHNRKILLKPVIKNAQSCNCRDKSKCPFNGSKFCDIGPAVYKAEVKTGDPLKGR